MRTVWIAENTMPLALQMAQKSVHQSTGAMVFAVPPGFVARVSTQPLVLTFGRGLSLHGPEGLSVSSSRVIFAGAQNGARTVPRSLCLRHPATRPFHSVCAIESTSGWAMTATAQSLSWRFRSLDTLNAISSSESTHAPSPAWGRKCLDAADYLSWAAGGHEPTVSTWNWTD
jgi:hypothetical protein